MASTNKYTIVQYLSQMNKQKNVNNIKSKETVTGRENFRFISRFYQMKISPPNYVIT